MKKNWEKSHVKYINKTNVVDDGVFIKNFKTVPIMEDLFRISMQCNLGLDR